MRQPKVLLAFDGRSLLARHLAILRQAGVTDVTIVVGYGAGQSARRWPRWPGVRSTVDNPDFREGSVVSLWAARDVLRAGGRSS